MASKASSKNDKAKKTAAKVKADAKNNKTTKGKTAKKSKPGPVSYPAIVEETRVVRGIRLPWQRVERDGPRTLPDGTIFGSDRPTKGTVLESGEVFIPLADLQELAEQDQWDSQFGMTFLLGTYEGYALTAAGLAEQETRGGYHRTDALLDFLDNGR